MIKCDTIDAKCKMSASGNTADLLEELQTIIAGLTQQIDKRLVWLAIGAIIEEVEEGKE